MGLDSNQSTLMCTNVILAMVKILHVGYLNAVGWGKDPLALVTLVIAIRVGHGAL